MLRQFLTFILLLLFTGFTFELSAQTATPSKLDIELSQLAADPLRTNDPIHLVASGDPTKIWEWCESTDNTFKSTFQGKANLMLRLGDLNAFAQQPFVEKIETNLAQGQTLSSNGAMLSRATNIYNGTAPLANPYTGNGIIIGVIDAGIELRHPDFMDSLGNTKIIKLWDQKMGFDAQRTPSFGYGQVWDSIDINDSICPHQDQPNQFGHGTNVTGIAAGNGNATGENKGVAPDAEVIVVSSNFGAIGWPNTVADAVEWIFEEAEKAGKPCVINASIGNYRGPHDGKDAPTQRIESLLDTKSGRAFVCAAGNSGSQAPYHLSYPVTSDTNFSYVIGNPLSTLGPNSIFLDIYADTVDFDSVYFQVGMDDLSSSSIKTISRTMPFSQIHNRLDVVTRDTLRDSNGVELAEIQTFATQLGDRYYLQIVSISPDSGHYEFRLNMTGSGSFDMWSGRFIGMSEIMNGGLPTIAQVPEIANYKYPDKQMSIVDAWACSEKTITVGNYQNRTSYSDIDSTTRNTGVVSGRITDDSSWGPSRTRYQKPDVSAPGGMSMSAGTIAQLDALKNSAALRFRVLKGGWHHRVGGTSMASPNVAGIVALYLEQCPLATWKEIRDDLITNTYTDGHTGAVPNFQYGNGKADAFAMLSSRVIAPTLVSSSGGLLCPMDSTELLLLSSHANYNWSTGDTTASIFATQAGTYQTTVTDSIGCIAISGDINIQRRPLPLKPIINISETDTVCFGDTISLSVPNIYKTFQWQGGGNTSKKRVTFKGKYYTRITDFNDCWRYSDTIEVSFYPLPSQPSISFLEDTLTAIGDPDIVAYQWYKNNAIIAGANSDTLVTSEKADYGVEVTNAGGCSEISGLVYRHTPASIQGIQLSNAIEVFPNPAKDELRISGDFQSLMILNMLGQIVHQTQQNANNGVLTIALSDEDFPSGTYFIESTNNGVVGHNRFIIQR